MKWSGCAVLLLFLSGWNLSGEEVVELSPYVVEAWHFDALGLEIPADVVRIESAELESSLGVNVPEVLTELAGVRFQSFAGNGMEGQLAMRGFGDNSGLRVLVLVDGLSYNPSDMGGINWSGMDISELETVEVIRGGQSVLYGNHAVSGVIKLRTREPGKELEGKVRIGGGSHSGLHGSVGLGRAFAGLGLRAGIHFMETDGFRENSAHDSHGGYLTWKHDGLRTGEWTGRFQVDSATSQYPGPLTFEEALNNPRQSGYEEDRESRTDSFMGTISGARHEEWGEWETQAGYLNRDRQWREGLADSPSGSYSTNQQERLTVNPRIRIPFGKSSLIAGADIQYDWLDTSNFISAFGGIKRARAELERTTIGGYLFARKALGSTVEISGGLRIEQADTDYRYSRFKEEQLRPELETNRGTIPNPDYRERPEEDPALSFRGPVSKSGWAAEISIVKTMTKSVSLWGGWDRVYRYPSLDETASYQDFPLSIPFNTTLDPETGHNLEIGIKNSEKNLTTGLTLFLLRMDDEIFFDESALLNRNFGDTERYGVELDTSLRFENAGLAARISWIDAGFRGSSASQNGDRIPLVPEFSTVISGWLALSDSLRLSVTWQYRGNQVQGNDFLNTNRKIPDYDLTSMSLLWSLSGNIDLTLRINNLFDQRVITTAYSGGFYPGAGREFRMGVRTRF